MRAEARDGGGDPVLRGGHALRVVAVQHETVALAEAARLAHPGRDQEAGRQQPLRDRAADAARRTGDHRDAVLGVEHPGLHQR